MSSKVYDNRRGRSITPARGRTIKFRVNQSWNLLDQNNLGVGGKDGDKQLGAARRMCARVLGGVVCKSFVTTTTSRAFDGERHIAPLAELHFRVLDYSEIRELKVGGLPRSLRANAERSQPCGARIGDTLKAEDVQDRRHTVRILCTLEMALERVAAGEPGILPCRFSPTRAGADPADNLREVPIAMFHAHAGVIEDPKAVANTAVTVLLCEPWAPICGLIVVIVVIVAIALPVLLPFFVRNRLRRHLVEALALNE